MVGEVCQKFRLKFGGILHDYDAFPWDRLTTTGIALHVSPGFNYQLHVKKKILGCGLVNM